MRYHDDEGEGRRSGGAGPKTKTAPTRKARRGRKGQGSVFWNEKRRRYLGKVPVGRNLDGSTKYLSVSDETEAGCIAKLQTAKAPDAKTTLAQWFAAWFPDHPLSPQTRDQWERIFRIHVLPILGHLPVAGLTPHQVGLAFSKWLARGMNPNTVLSQARIFGTCLECAVDAGLIVVNPVRKAKKPKPRKVEIILFALEELEEFYRSAHPLFVLMGSIGCRIGEGIALDVEDLDRRTGVVSISKSQDRRRGPKRPKSENGIREVRIPSHALPAIVAAAGSRETGPLFRNKHGGRCEQTAAGALWSRYLRRQGLRYRRPHNLRHSIATHWIAAGVPLMDVAKKLGDTLETVVARYLHPTGTDPSEAFERAFESARRPALGGNKVAGPEAAAVLPYKSRAI